MDAARQLLERAAILFPDRPEAQTYLEDVRRQLGRTKVDSVTAEPVLPLRPEQFREGKEYRGITTGNIWRIDKRLGEGSMGVVFRVMNKAADTGTSYALKTFKTAEAWQDGFKRRFEREALIWVQLGHHPNIVRAFWVERLEGIPCIIMEYIATGTLKDTLHRQGALPPKRALALALNLCDGLYYAHEHLGIVHRDVKPSNCLIDADGTLKIADFGISTAIQSLNTGLGRTSTAHPNVTRNAGTPIYEAPEQRDPTTVLDERADIHAFGITFAEILTGKLLDRNAILEGITRGRFAGSLWEVARQCVEPDRERRPRDFRELRQKLDTCYAKVFGRPAPPPPKHPEATPEEDQDRGATFIALGMHALAVQSFEHALGVRPEDPALWAGLSAAYLEARQYTDAISVADKGLALGRRTSSLLNNKGRALLAEGRLEEALVYFRDASDADPSNPMVLHNLSNALWKMRRHSEAMTACEAALNIAPRYVGALVLKANILFDQNRTEESQAVLVEAIRINPQDGEALFGLSWILDRLGKTSEAFTRLELALTVDPENSAMLRQKGWLLLKLDRPSEAIGILDTILDRDPIDIEALRGKCFALLAKGDREAALETIRLAARIDPDNSPVREALRLAEGFSVQTQQAK